MRIIQVAGISNLKEAEMLIEEKVNFLGFPLRLLDGREDLDEKSAQKIIKKINTKAKTIVITYQNSAKEIKEFCDFLNVKGIQLHGNITISELKQLRKKNPTLFIIKSLIINTKNIDELYDMIMQMHPYVDAFITDTYDPKSGRSGATGKTHDWKISRQLVLESPKPVILAGGLSAENVAIAIDIVRPAGVDVHTLVELQNGQKSVDLVRKFVKETSTAFQKIANEV